MTSSKSASVNYGIQANSVTSEVTAVGENAKAVKLVKGGEQRELLKAISELESAIAKLNLPQPNRQELQGHVSDLVSAAKQDESHSERVGRILQHITNGLKSAGVAVKEIADLIGPIQKIAGVAHLGMAALGLV